MEGAVPGGLRVEGRVNVQAGTEEFLHLLKTGKASQVALGVRLALVGSGWSVRSGLGEASLEKILTISSLIPNTCSHLSSNFLEMHFCEVCASAHHTYLFGGLHSTEVALTLLSQQPQVRISILPKFFL